MSLSYVIPGHFAFKEKELRPEKIISLFFNKIFRIAAIPFSYWNNSRIDIKKL